jgi:hypothetical protein
MASSTSASAGPGSSPSSSRSVRRARRSAASASACQSHAPSDRASSRQPSSRSGCSRTSVSATGTASAAAPLRSAISAQASRAARYCSVSRATSAVAHRAALLEHLDDEEEHILPLIAEHLTVAEWARLGERFAEEVPRSKMLFFLGMILEDADPAERQAMMAYLPAPARFLWRTVGQRQYRRKVSKIRGGLDRP